MHTPNPDEPALAEDLRAQHGVPWSDTDVHSALTRITHVLGDDAAAAGQARGALRMLAQRRTCITNLGGFMRRMTDEQIRDELRVPEPPTGTSADPRFRGLLEDAKQHAIREHHSQCDGDGWAGTDDQGRRIPCLGCKPHLAKAAGA